MPAPTRRCGVCGCNGNLFGLASVLLSLMVLAGCQTGNSELTPSIKTYEHSSLYEQEYFLLQGFGSPKVGINPRGTEIEQVTLAWGKAPLSYGGSFIFEDESEWEDSAISYTDAGNTNIKIWTSKFDRVDVDPNADPPPKGTIAEGERFDYKFRIKYRPQGSDTTKIKWSPAQSIAVAPDNGKVLLRFDPYVSGQTNTLNVGQEITLRVELSPESNFPRTVHLSTSPSGRVKILDTETGQQISKVTFEPNVTYHEVKAKAVSGNNTQGDTITITGKASGWLTGTTEVAVFP